MKWLLLLVTSCASVRNVPSIQEIPVSPSQPPPALAARVELPVDSCVDFTKLGHRPPVHISERGFVVTAVQEPCITYDGMTGYYRHSSWVAMGIPCSAGQGTVEVRGKVIAPKEVSFVLATDCPMKPQQKIVANYGTSHLGFDDTSKLLAYNPFTLQFWALPNFPDAGTGFIVTLRSRVALDELWDKFRNGQPINVHLYGRENAWVAQNQIYFVDANIVAGDEGHFQLEVLEVRTLSREEIAATKRRCNMLRPKQQCHLIF